MLRHSRIWIHSGGDINSHGTYSPATVSYIVHFRAESGDFPPEHSLCPYSQQAVQQDHRFSRMGKGRGLVFLRGRRYFRQLPHGKFTPFVARVSGSEAYFPAMLFQYVKDGEGISPVIPFAYIGYAQSRVWEELHERFRNTGRGQFHQGSGWCSANDELAFRDLHIFRGANFHGILIEAAFTVS